MARFEVFIPAVDPDGLNLTLRVTADTWMAALKIGLKKIGGAVPPRDVLCDVHEDESIHVTDPRSGRVFRIIEIPEVSDPGVLVRTVSAQPNLAAPPPLQRPPESPAPAPPPVPAPQARAPAPAATPRTSPPAREPSSAPARPAASVPPRPAASAPARESAAAPAQAAAPKPAQAQEAKAASAPAASAPLARPRAPAPPVASSASSVKAAPPRPAEAAAPAALPLAARVPPPEPRPPRRAPAAGEPPKKPTPVKVVEVAAPKKTPPKQIGRPGDATSVEEVLIELFEKTPAVFEKGRSDALYFLLDLAMEKIPAESGSVYVADLNRRDLTFAAARGPKSKELLALGLRVPMGRGFVGFCAQEGVAVAISDAQRDPRFFRDISERLGYETRSVLTTPIIAGGRTLGAMQLLNKKGSSSFTHGELSILHYVAHQAALYLEVDQ